MTRVIRKKKRNGWNDFVNGVGDFATNAVGGYMGMENLGLARQNAATNQELAKMAMAKLQNQQAQQGQPGQPGLPGQQNQQAQQAQPGLPGQQGQQAQPGLPGQVQSPMTNPAYTMQNNGFSWGGRKSVPWLEEILRGSYGGGQGYGGQGYGGQGGMGGSFGGYGGFRP